MKTSLSRRVVGLFAAGALVLTACGGSDDDSSSDAEEPAETTAEEPEEEPAEEEPAEEAEEEPAEDAEEEPAEEADAETEAEDDATEPAEEEPAGEPELAELTLGLIPIADVAPVFIAIERGYFEEEGLTVTTEFAAGGAAAIPALQAGDIDLAFGGYPSTYTAIQAGLDLVVTQEAVEGAPLFAGFYSLPDSGIASPADMAGATVAVNTLNNIVQMALEIQLQEAGLELTDVTLVEIPFPDQVAALELGDVDVISVVEPFGTIARNTLDATLVVDMFSGPLEGFPVAGWQVTREFAEANPNTIAAFNRAFAKATDVAVNEEGALAAIVPTYTSATPELAAELNYPNMISGLDTAQLQLVPDLMLEQGLLEEAIDVTAYVFES